MRATNGLVGLEAFRRQEVVPLPQEHNVPVLVVDVVSGLHLRGGGSVWLCVT